MKRYIAAVLFGLAACLTLSAQNIEEEGGDPVQTVGSEVQVDSTLDGHTIFQVLPDGVAVNQSPAVRSALERQIESNSRKQFSGFRIRIYFDRPRTPGTSPSQCSTVSRKSTRTCRATGHTNPPISRSQSATSATGPRPTPPWRHSRGTSQAHSSSGRGSNTLPWADTIQQLTH